MRRFKRGNANQTSMVCIAAIVMSCAAPSWAQDVSEDNNVESYLDEVIVTGSKSGITALETSYGVSVLSQEALQRDAPVGLADLADAIPGLQGEYANGEVNSNLNVRGTQAGFLSFISLQEDGLPVQYSPFFSEYQIRNDLTYERVEAVLGGPSGVFTAQGAAATLNFITRVPTEEEGQIRTTITDFGQYRGDFFYGAPLGDTGWTGSVGGFYRGGDSIRDLGFTASNGGQIRANLRKEFERGDVSFSYKKIDDRVDYAWPLPTDISGDEPVEINGFDPRDSSLVGPDTRVINAVRPDGITTRDLADGQRTKTDQFTIALNYAINDKITFTNKTRYNNIETVSHDLRNGGDDASIFQATDFVADQLSVLQAAFPTTTSVRLVGVNSGETISDLAGLNGNGLVTLQNHLAYSRDFQHFINDARVDYEGENVFLTAGLQFWDITSNSSQQADQLLTDIRPNAQRLNVQALDAAGAVVGNLTADGVTQFSIGGSDNFGGLDTTSFNPYVNAEVKLGDRLRIDGGLRYESATIEGFGEDVDCGVAVPEQFNDPLVLADDTFGCVRNGNLVNGEVDIDEVTWTVGGNFKVNDDLAVYARYASAHDMGFTNEFTFFNIPTFGAPAGSNLGLNDEATRLNFAEAGVRYIGDLVSGSATFFYTEHEDAGTVTGDENGVAVIVPGDVEAFGVEFNFDVRPTTDFNVNVSGVIMDTELNGGGISNPVARLPETQIRVAPTYNFGRGQVFAGLQYYSSRFANTEFVAELPSYISIDGGVSFDVSDAIAVTVQGTNLTNELAFTAGNFAGGTGTNGFGFNSVVPGRSLQLSVDYRF